MALRGEDLEIEYPDSFRSYQDLARTSDQNAMERDRERARAERMAFEYEQERARAERFATRLRELGLLED